MTEMSKAKTEPADYAKAMTDFASANAEVAAENIAAFAEVAKKVQMDTVELMMAAGKEFQEDTAKVVKQATDEVTANAKKATRPPASKRNTDHPPFSSLGAGYRLTGGPDTGSPFFFLAQGGSGALSSCLRICRSAA